MNGHDVFLEKVLASPCHQAPLQFGAGSATCSECQQEFGREDGIWRAFWPHEKFETASDVTRVVQSFYEENPFPNYDEHDTIRSLIEKARAGVYARVLDRSIPYNSSVLEVGCGTGQLSNFLGISCRRVVGADLCLNSLKLGERFRREQQLSRVRFVQMNLFRPCFQDEQFDVVLCNGVLHHTADPRGGFDGLLRLVKPGGYVVVGLYNTWGRLFTDARRLLFRLTSGRAKWVDPVLRSLRDDSARAKRAAWYADQYRHPHESKHTMGEVLGWFDDNGLEFVRGVPALTPGPDSLESSSLFDPRPRGTGLDRFVVQAEQVVLGNREGGFFLMIARKAGGAAVDKPAARSARLPSKPAAAAQPVIEDLRP
jgi:ubiquinone/menaquinone biosynthesis C-methylase UbiE